MKTFLTVLGIIAVILIIAVVVLYFVGKKLQKRQSEQQKQIEAQKMTVSLLVFDKGKRKLKDAGLPPAVLAQTPKYMRGVKFPVVKGQVSGNQIRPMVMTLICEGSVYDLIPLKQSVTATISGIYLTDVRAKKGGHLATPPKKKKGFLSGLRKKAQAQLDEQQKKGKKKK